MDLQQLTELLIIVFIVTKIASRTHLLTFIIYITYRYKTEYDAQTCVALTFNNIYCVTLLLTLQMSYPVQCISAVQKVVPKHSCLGFEGDMRFTTTQQHDYYVPCNNDGFGRGNKTVRSDNLVVGSRLPMAKLTTSYCSYQPVCAKRQKNFKPNIW